ncbi:hypothetical protein [Dehalogenimonas alkenigignens]|uniref:hypothetical protein n=1 Tax=Dehalogenimonas alkenigignens TaxID=1217799 RepID=UPI00196A4A30|nr:hypothetical protein [Dehalogenimonas alkenigignens]
MSTNKPTEAVIIHPMERDYMTLQKTLQTLPRRCRVNNKIVSYVYADYDRQCSECDNIIKHGARMAMVYDTRSDGFPVGKSCRRMHADHVKAHCATERRMVGEF